jgi:sulfite reductase beta subunit-like hemoprotein
VVAVRVVLGELTSDQLDGLAGLARAHADGRLWLTKRQNLELRFVPGGHVLAALAGVRDLGLRVGDTDGFIDVQACVGMEYCPIGVTSAQLVAAQLIEQFEATPPTPAAQALRVNLSACPNSCGQHHVGDIGFSGMRLPEKQGGGPGYQLFLGGQIGLDARFGVPVARLRESDAAATAAATAETFEAERRAGEHLADVVARLGVDGMRERLAARLGTDVLIPMADSSR